MGNAFIKELGDAEFNMLSQFIFSNFGIKMPYAKKNMLQARLQSRLKETQLDNFRDYCEYIFSNRSEDKEIVKMIDVVSTNKTDFFRESAHFDYMTSTVLPEFMQKGTRENFSAWSAACSSGEEVYTIAITLSEFSAQNKGFDYSIHGTDISSRVLQKACDAVYHEEKIAGIPMALKKKYFLRSSDKTSPNVRVVKELRQKASYQRLNLMDDSYQAPKNFDVIFCRNVLIYFDRKTQESVINKLCAHLKPDGYFFLGHSESITGINVPLKQIRPTIFRKINKD